jgi:uncharacterized protein
VATRKDAVRNRARLIDAAREVFARHGLDATLDEIAERAGLGTGTADRHVRNKHELATVAPDDASRALVAPDGTAASLVFPIAPVSLSERERLLDDLAADLEGDLAPPPGVTATPAGLAVVGVELVNGLEAGRQTLTVIALGLVLVWLVVAQRRVTRAVLVLIPVAAAVGLSSLAVAALGIELTPLTTVAGRSSSPSAPEFSVLVLARYVEERGRGRNPAQAVHEGVPQIGRAFIASGLTLIAGFGVLAFSPRPLLRDFGIVVALAVLFALASTLVQLPPLLVWADERRWLRGFRPEAPSPAEPVTAGRTSPRRASRTGR